jgi:hypothetical protein
VGICVVIAAMLTVAGPAAGDSSPALSLHASAQQVASGHRVALTGGVTGAPAGAVVTMYSSPYPYGTRSQAATAAAGQDGSFSFTVQPDRDTRYQVALPGSGTTSPTVEVDVTGLTITKVHALTLGRAEVTIVVFHPRDLSWGGATVRWWFASGHGPFLKASATRTHTLSPHVIVVRKILSLPAGKFRFRACFHAPGDQALSIPRRPPGCSGQGYQDGGSLPVGFPSPAAVAGAGSYLAGRGGRTAFAVIDSEGRLGGVNVHWTFPTASVVKAMLLVAYLRRLDANGRHRVDSYSNSFLYPMIHVSDNNAATQCWSIVGDAGLYSVAGAARMTDFSVSGLWGSALLSPADQARFFFEMDSLIPREFVGYARFLLSTIDPSQSWAIPQVARPLGYTVFFKDGSEPTGLGQLVHQVARLEGHDRTFSMAVMTDGDPTMAYGIDTIRGLTSVLLGSSH